MNDRSEHSGQISDARTAKSDGRPAALIARFANANFLVDAARAAHADGIRRLDAYSPFAIDELPDALGIAPSRLRRVMLIAGAIGAALGYLMQYWSAVVSYRFNSGGRPLDSWPAFLPIAFELAILFAAAAGLVAFFIAAPLTDLHHPLFDVAALETASSDGFFLLIGSDDPAYDRHATEARLRAWGAIEVAEVQRC